MRWLIVEDALRDQKGHWFEYISTFSRGLRALGDQVAILADHHAEPFVLKALEAKPVLPDSIWHRMGDGAGAWTRYLRVPTHAWKTWQAVGRFLKSDNDWDIVFIPTVLVHHLLGWYGLIRCSLRGKRARVLLFFPNLPIFLSPDGTSMWNPSPTTHLMRWLLKRLKPDILAGRVLLGVETVEMRDAFTKLLELPVIYFPHPVEHLEKSENKQAPDKILMACYGPGRPEKGSDVLQEALDRHLKQFPDSQARFVFQWTQDFKNAHGQNVGISPSLEFQSRVNIISRYFGEGEYAQNLLQTQVMLLPYRRSSYALRVSRVAIEAMVNGIPMVTTNGTTLSVQAAEFGALIGCEDGSAESLCEAIETAERSYPQLRARAIERMPVAREHFSVKRFRELLFGQVNYHL